MRKKEIIIIIRAADERTFSCCHRRAIEEVGEANVAVVSDVPFTRTLARTFELGIRLGATWTMTLDADVLLRSNAVELLVREAKKMPSDSIQIEGEVYDYLSGLFRPAGHRIYRTASFPRLLELLPGAMGSIRPESLIIRQMATGKSQSMQVPVTIGIHDFGQYLKDVYRKCLLHGIKSRFWSREFIERWTESQEDHECFKVALHGFCDGLLGEQTVVLDAPALRARSEAVLKALSLNEISDLDPEAFSADEIDQILAAAGRPNEANVGDFSGGQQRVGTGLSGMLPRMLDSLGSVICRAGNRIRWMARGR